MGVDRKTFVSGLAAFAAVPQEVSAVPDSRIRSLWLRRASSNEELRVPFTRDGRQIYKPGYYALSWLLRDHNVDPSFGYVAIDIRLIEVLYEVQTVLRLRGIRGPIDITSGYRTPGTNAEAGGVINSQHLWGKAADFFVDGVSNRDLFDIGWSRRLTGGDGCYGDHVHMDVGERRWWDG